MLNKLIETNLPFQRLVIGGQLLLVQLLPQILYVIWKVSAGDRLPAASIVRDRQPIRSSSSLTGCTLLPPAAASHAPLPCGRAEVGSTFAVVEFLLTGEYAQLPTGY